MQMSILTDTEGAVLTLMLGYRSLYITWQQRFAPIKFFLIWDRRFHVCRDMVWVKGQRSTLAIRRGFELYECLLVLFEFFLVISYSWVRVDWT